MKKPLLLITLFAAGALADILFCDFEDGKKGNALGGILVYLQVTATYPHLSN